MKQGGAPGASRADRATIMVRNASHIHGGTAMQWTSMQPASIGRHQPERDISNETARSTPSAKSDRLQASVQSHIGDQAITVQAVYWRHQASSQAYVSAEGHQ